MKKVLICSLLVAALGSVQAQTKTTAKAPAAKAAVKPVMKNLLDSFSYAAGYNVATNMKEQGITTINLPLMQKGMDDVFKKATASLSPELASQVLQRQIEIFTKAKGAADRAKGVAYLQQNRVKPGVIVLPSGVQYEIIKRSDSMNKPKPKDTVIVNYIGRLTDGTEFESSFKNGQPIVFPYGVGGIIQGWTEVLGLMSVGSHWKVTIPSDLAYGEYPRPGSGIPPHSVLVFEMVLEGIKPAVEAPAGAPTPGQ